MQAYLTLTRRELSAFLLSPTGYIIIAAAVFLMDCSCLVVLLKLQGEPSPMTITELFYNSFFFWLIPLLLTAVITMRLFAFERSSGTYETLMTTPVSDLQVVGAKFTAAVAFYTLMWLPLLGCLSIIKHYTRQGPGLDVGVVGITFVGIFLLGCLFLSLGCLASALTRSQVVAAIVSLALNTTLVFLSFLPEPVPKPDWKSQVLAFFALFDQMHDFARGILDTRPVLLYLSATMFFLFLTLKVVESRRWK